MSSQIEISPSVKELVQNFKLPSEIGFGRVLSPIMVICEFSDEKWGQPKLVPYAPLTIDPTSKVLHYGQEIFEGMKAYSKDQKGPFLFRPEQNWERFNFSARRMAMPEVPEDIFMNSVKSIVLHSKEIIPTNSGESLYIRPFMFANEEHLGIKPSEKFLFMVVASPSGSYFSTGALNVLIERNAVRACPGGTGAAKTGGNYAASLISARKAKSLGYDQTLWLDAIQRTNVEELSGMNFFAVINGVLTTPPASDTILSGITRKSLLDLAAHLEIKTQVRTINIEQLKEDILSGRCSECFSCGTAAIITPIASLVEENGQRFELKDSTGEISTLLKSNLLAIQEGDKVDPFGWSVKVS